MDLAGYQEKKEKLQAAQRAMAAAARELSLDRQAGSLEEDAALLATEKFELVVVGEFSRGKSELINAIFFADYGQRIVPSSAGRTTMCPTELLYDETLPPSIRLLPIETRAGTDSTRDTPGPCFR